MRVVFVTVPDEEVGVALVTALLEANLVAAATSPGCSIHCKAGKSATTRSSCSS